MSFILFLSLVLFLSLFSFFLRPVFFPLFSVLYFLSFFSLFLLLLIFSYIIFTSSISYSIYSSSVPIIYFSPFTFPSVFILSFFIFIPLILFSSSVLSFYSCPSFKFSILCWHHLPTKAVPGFSQILQGFPEFLAELSSAWKDPRVVQCFLYSLRILSRKTYSAKAFALLSTYTHRIRNNF